MANNPKTCGDCPRFHHTEGDHAGRCDLLGIGTAPEHVLPCAGSSQDDELSEHFARIEAEILGEYEP